MNINLILLLITGAFVGAVSGYLGSFMVLKRMSLVGDALSHVALPGMAIALILNLSPMFGAFVSLTLAVIGVWYLSEKSEIYPEALVGVFFTASLAIGILITPQPELLEALFGNFEKINLLDGAIISVSSILIFTVISFIAKRLLLGIVSEDLAKAEGVKMKNINLIYLLLVGFVVALGVKFVGTLLMGALVVVPAVAAKNFSKSIRSYQILGSLLGVFSVTFGLLISTYFHFSSGPIIVLVSIVIFILSYIFKKK